MLHPIDCDNRPKRRKIFHLDVDRLQAVLEGRLEIYGLPKDVKIIAVSSSWSRQTIDILLESETFEEIAPGAEIPSLESSPYAVKVVETPKEQFGYMFIAVKENAEKLTDKDGKVKFREFI